MDRFGLVEAVDRLGQGIVAAVADAADRRLDAGLGEALGALDRDLSHAVIALLDEAGLADQAPIMEGLLQGIKHELGPRLPRHPPADNASGERINHEDDVDETGPGGPTQVKSETHSAFGHSALSCRLARPSGQGLAGSLIVVRTGLPRTVPFRPIRRIRRDTVQRATSWPSRRSCRQALWTPSTSKFSVQTRQIASGRTVPRQSRTGAWTGPVRRAACSRQVVGAIGSTRQIGSTLSTSRCASMNAFMACAGGRTPPGQEARRPCAGSRSPGAARGSPVPAP